jgi:transcriptional regulator with XRE-family HTH domain
MFREEVLTMTTGQKIQTVRKQRNLTQEQLAAQIHVSRQAISRWELDEVLPDTQHLLPLKKILGVSIDSLLDPDLEVNKDDKRNETNNVSENLILTSSQQLNSKKSKFRAKYLLLLPPILVIAYSVVIGIAVYLSSGTIPKLTWMMLVYGFALCIPIYIVYLIVVFLRYGIRYYRCKTTETENEKLKNRIKGR